VTGVIALLLEGAARDKIPVTPEKLRQALALGSKKLTGFTDVEQGYGKLDAMGAWTKLRELTPQPIIIAKTYNAVLAKGSGLYAREFNPGELDCTLQNLSTENLQLQLTSTQLAAGFPWRSEKKLLAKALAIGNNRLMHKVKQMILLAHEYPKRDRTAGDSTKRNPRLLD
ncbi:MAG TPA: hypothetical protein VHS59_05685, partial [Bacillota bacterium]|nr:hypothetical protein [Bacillota bacterium]